MDRLKQTIKQNCMVIIYVTFSASFASIALWDVKEIVQNYLDDNRFTSVQTRNSVEDKYPFLSNPLVYLIYDQPLIPNVTWIEFASMLNDSWHRREIAWPEHSTESTKSMAMKIFALVKLDLIGRIHGTTSIDGNRGVDRIVEMLKIDAEKAARLADAFIEDPRSVDIIRNALHDKQLRQGFAQNYRDKSSGIIESVSYQHASGSQGMQLELSVGVSLNLVADLTAQKQNLQTSYGLDFVDFEMNNRNAPSAKKVLLTFPNDRSFHSNGEFERLSNDTHIMIQVEISNSQLMDSKRFPPCTTEYNIENECVINLELMTREKICDCQQLTRKTVMDTKSETNGKPFCTIRKYEQCRKKVIEEIRRQTNEFKLQCKPCSFATNNVKITTQQESYHPDFRIHPPIPGVDIPSSIQYPSFELTFVCDKGTYLLYEEKPQFNFSQLVSQIGGDLGLYIGFSMISILQLILFLYHMHQQGRNSGTSGRSATKNWRDGVRFYLAYITKSFKNNGCENALKLQELTEHVLRLEQRTEVTLEKLEQSLKNISVKRDDSKREDTQRRLEALEAKIDQLLSGRMKQNSSRVAYRF